MPSPDFLPTASLTTLRRRAALLAAVREFFTARGYWEVETPIVSHEIVNDAHLEPFTTAWRPAGSAPAKSEFYLQTSPEAHMKRLLAAGADAIFQVSRVMRNGERGRLHNPEFTLLEWYRAGDTHIEQMTLTEQLVQAVFRCAVSLGACNAERIPAGPFERLTYDAAFERHAGTRVLALPMAELRSLAERHRIALPSSLAADDRDGLLNLLLAELVEPHLGRDGPVFLHDYPASQAALARTRVENGVAVAERFELYLEGIELCNGYHELTDAGVLRERMDRQNNIRLDEGVRPLPLQERLLAAMKAGLPPCAGVALGLDRLFMLALGFSEIRDVIAFPWDRA